MRDAPRLAVQGAPLTIIADDEVHAKMAQETIIENVPNNDVHVSIGEVFWRTSSKGTQTYVVVGLESHSLQDGTLGYSSVMCSKCRTCGALFYFKSSALFAVVDRAIFGTVHCPQHRARYAITPEAVERDLALAVCYSDMAASLEAELTSLPPQEPEPENDRPTMGDVELVKYAHIATLVRDFLKTRGWTPRQLANVLGMKSTSQIYGFMDGRGAPGSKYIGALARVMGIDPEQLRPHEYTEPTTAIVARPTPPAPGDDNSHAGASYQDELRAEIAHLRDEVDDLRDAVTAMRDDIAVALALAQRADNRTSRKK